MHAVVKTPHTEIVIKGILSDKVLEVLEKEYGDAFHIIENEKDADIDIFQTDWYHFVKASMTPGDYLRSHRERLQLTQTALGKHLGGIPRQHISNMERGIRPISVKMAKMMAKLFKTDFSIFLAKEN